MTDNEFVEKFINIFAKDITEQQKRKASIGKKYNGYLWHLFNYKLLSCFEGNEARAEYNKVDKTDAFEIQYDNGYLGDKETTRLDQAHTSAEGVDNASLPEFYIIGKDFSWCYVVTHEFNLCGPYFCYAPKTK